jgi:DNA-binding winged helix-turn-helix (wHTH) protein
MSSGPPLNMPSIAKELRRFGPFELDLEVGEVRRDGRRVKLQPQPFRLLVLLTSRPGSLISRDEIRSQLWPDGTFVDFDQSVNFAVKQIRDAIGDSATQPVYVETVPRQGYRFVAPVDGGPRQDAAVPFDTSTGTTVRLHKAIWANIAELQMADARHRRLLHVAIAGLAIVLTVMILYAVLR